MSTVQPRAGADQERTDCTTSCRLRDHACKCLASVALGDIKLLHKLESICANPYCIKDDCGRNSLHVAASLGHSDIATQLVREKCVNVNEPDGESAWTALHRSAYFGQLETAVELTKLGSELYVADNDGWTPLDLFNSDMLTHCIGAKELGLSALSTWGANANATLGHEHSRTVPEQLSIDQRLTVKQVVLCKFHSVLLVSSGEVMTCGLGRGGRLGHGNEHAIMEPTAISALSKVKVVQIDASRNHSVFLDSKGDAYTCGFNEAHQLGQGTNPTTAPPSAHSPTQIKGVRGVVIGVGAGRFHTAFATEVALYTCGEDHGQLGYKAKYLTQIAPRQVPFIELHEKESITLLSVSDAATACLTSSRRIFLCYDYSVRLISMTNQYIDPEMCFIQFTVCATLGDYEKKKKQILSSPVIITMLSTSGEFWYWTMDMKSFHRGSFSGLAHSKVKHYTLGKKLTVVTRLGEVFTCDTSSLNQDSGKGSSSAQRISSGRGGLDVQSSGLLQVSRLGNIQSASCIFTDFKSSNFALVQQFYSPAAKPALEQTHYPDDILSLRQGDQWFMDCILKVNEHKVPCHRYLLADRSTVVLPQLEAPEGLPSDDSNQPCTVDLSTAAEEKPVSLKALQVFADYIYCVGIELSFYVSRKEQDRKSVSDEHSVADPGATPAEPPRSPVVPGGTGEDYDDPFHLTTTTSSVLHAGTVHQSDYVGLCQLLQHTQVVNPKQGQHRGRFRVLPALPALKYSKSSSVADFFIETSDCKSLPCHRCIIVARSDYFRSMLTMGWKESYEEVAVHLPFPSQLVQLVLEYLYSDGIDAIHNIDTEVVMELLVASDQLLISQLRLFCEVELANRVTLKQVVELAEFAHIYNAHQLFVYCLQLISFNFTYYLAGGYLQGISPEVLTRLSKVYQDMLPITKRRLMRVSAPADINFVTWLLTSERDAQPGSSVISSTPVVGPVVPARVQSGPGRKKRRRKVSKGDYGRGQVSPVPVKGPEQQSPTVGDKSPEPTAETKSSTQEVLKAVDVVHTPVADSSRVQEVVSQSKKQLKENRTSKDLQSGFHLTEADAKVKVAWKTVGSPQTSVNFQKIQHEQASSAPRTPLKPSSRQPKAPPPPKQQLCPAPPKPWPAVPWSVAPVSPPVPSLLEVMLQEAERETQTPTAPSQPVHHSNDRSVQHSKPVGRGKSTSAASSPPPVWSSEAPQSSRRSHNSSGASVSFAAIIADQQKETESQSRHQAKPMEDIEMEERAIQQLELLYQVSDCADEWITVERDITLTEKPTWVKECM